MMKKTLLLFFVVALVAQICARPHGKDDEEKAAQEAAGKVSEEGKDKADELSKKGTGKVREASKKGEEEAKHYADKGKEVADDLQKKGKDATEELSKHGKGHNADSNKQHGHPLSAAIRQTEKTGEKFIERGTNMFADFVENFGF